ncbi:glutathionylspermidine synthase family protein [Hyalangium rubrum]|uniref:Glutathionylspermidine synthase family protein n=1 Tax=Hyalangium rubrum TaxID=3103134 RepID=A0ABU5H6S2_9BACT|nr:glutathionylspermidine synthase family protein [Hyalangium sp. s54d21]MDY7228789.1 glutathionylspermidine synthase family protein [Hyalangium sp. s54d21]
MNASSLSYEALAERLLATGIVTDPWLSGTPRFRVEPLLLSRERQARLYRAAEDVAAAYHELSLACAASPEVLESFFALTPFQRLMWQVSQPFWHGIARADVFFTRDEGLAVCELNSDTPTGEAEAVLLNPLVQPSWPGTVDPNGELGERLCQMVESLAGRLLVPVPERLSVGIIYPTEMPEDLALVRLYRAWFEERGWTVSLGSPFNLSAGADGRVCLFGEPCDVLLRHYKTDWWAERLPVWGDEEPAEDMAPLSGPFSVVMQACLEGRCVVVNPFGAVLTQNKRAMAFMWEHHERFSPRARATIRAFVPYTVRMETVPIEELAKDREGWVLKSDYGAEGDQVLVGRHTVQGDWNAALVHAVPGRWVAQRYFAAEETAGGEAVNHGVYVIAGEAAGLYARVQRGATDTQALSAPVLVVP